MCNFQGQKDLFQKSRCVSLFEHSTAQPLVALSCHSTNAVRLPDGL